MNTSKIRTTIAVLVLAAVACTCPASNLPGVAPIEPATEEPGSQLPEIPTEPPVIETEVPGYNRPDPIGVGVQTADGLAFYNLDGTQRTSFSLPNSDYISWGYMIFAGGFTDSIAPIIYYTFANEGALWVKAPASIYELNKLDNLNAIVGAPGKDIFAYSRMDFSGGVDNIPSELYVGSLAAPPVTPVTIIQDSESWMIRTLALDANADALVGVWYTLGAWGIGGDIVYEPRKGLFYYDLGNGATTEWLNRQESPLALSNDLNWVAYSAAGAVGGPNSGVNLRNLSSGQTTNIPLASVSSEPRGAGNAVFSPNNIYIAWREASGWQMAETPDFHSRIRIADLNGNLILDIQDSAFSSLHSDWVHCWPVAWLDDQTLLVQVGWADTAVLARISLNDQTPTFFANGAFVGLMYP